MGERAEPGGARGVCSAGAEAESVELLDAIRRGDADALEAVAREHAPRLLRLAMRLCGKREDAEDLVQDTLVRALPALRNFEGRARLSTYLIRALGNLWRNRLRSQRRSRIVDWFRGGSRGEEAQDSVPEPVDEGPSALERLEAGDRAARVRLAVTRLDPARRWTLLLREVEELSYEEIAELTRVPLGTVRSRLARAREELRKLLGDEP